MRAVTDLLKKHVVQVHVAKPIDIFATIASLKSLHLPGRYFPDPTGAITEVLFQLHTKLHGDSLAPYLCEWQNGTY